MKTVLKEFLEFITIIILCLYALVFPFTLGVIIEQQSQLYKLIDRVETPQYNIRTEIKKLQSTFERVEVEHNSLARKHIGGK
jgi:predicted PurR-regulated permease PerM